MALIIIITQKPQIPWFFNFLPRKVVFVVSNLPSLCPESHWLWHRPPIFRGLLVIRWNGLAQWWCVFKWPAGPPLFARLELLVHQHLSPTIVLIFYQKIKVVKLSWVVFNICWLTSSRKSKYIWYIKVFFYSQICDIIVSGCHIIIISVRRSPSCIAEPRHHHLAVTLLRFCCPTRNSWQSQQDYGLMLNKLHAGTHSRVTLFGSNKSDFAPKMYSDLINFRCVRLCDVCLNCYPNCKSVRTKTVHNSQFAPIFAET